MNTLVRATLAGAATGSRSMSALAACGVTAPQLPQVLRVGSVLAACGELVADKLPQTPSRLQPPAFAARLVLGAVAGWIVGGRGPADRRVAAALGLTAAAASTVAGTRARGLLSDRLGSDLPGALGEDLTAITLAGLAVRRG